MNAKGKIKTTMLTSFNMADKMAYCFFVNEVFLPPPTSRYTLVETITIRYVVSYHSQSECASA